MVFSKKIKTEREFRIVVPKFDNEGHRISSEKIKEVALKMSKRFGGVSVFPKVFGCFAGEDDVLQCEENAIMSSVRDLNGQNESIFEKDKDFMRSLAKYIGKELGQESILIEEDIIKDATFVSGIRKESVPKEFREKDVFKKLLD